MTISNINNLISYKTYATDINVSKNKVQTAPTSTEGSAKNQSIDTVSISAAATLTQATDAFLAEQGQVLYEISIKNLKTYPENLASQLDDKSLSSEVRGAAMHALNEREINAFTKYAKQVPPDYKMTYKKYIEYLDTLSPEELQSDRYRGQRAQAVSTYERLSREQGEDPEDLSVFKDPILSLFDAIKEMDFNVKDAESLRNHYKEQVEGMFARSNGAQLKEESEQALERFDAVQAVLDAARGGNEESLDKLKQLTKDPSFIGGFMVYAEGFTQKLSA